MRHIEGTTTNRINDNIEKLSPDVLIYVITFFLRLLFFILYKIYNYLLTRDVSYENDPFISAGFL